MQARPVGATVSPQEITLTVLPALESGRRLIVVDAASRRPLAGVEVLGCDAPPASGPCPAPVTVTTDAAGVALFPGFTGATASFSAASAETRADQFPRYDRVSVVSTSARDVLLPLGENPVHGAAGFNAGISFNEVHSSGELSLGVSVLSAGDPTAVDLTNLFGETFLVPLPGLTQRIPAPGSLVAYASLGLAGNTELKGRSYGLGQAGRRTAIAFAGKLPLARATSLRPTDVLAYTGAMDFALQAFTPVSHLPFVPDETDLDGDGLCSDTTRCQGSEDLPDYGRFTGLTHRPRREQLRRTEVVVPNLPSGLDTAVIAAVELSSEAGLMPLGLASADGRSGPAGWDAARTASAAAQWCALRRGGAGYTRSVGSRHVRQLGRLRQREHRPRALAPHPRLHARLPARAHRRLHAREPHLHPLCGELECPGRSGRGARPGDAHRRPGTARGVLRAGGGRSGAPGAGLARRSRDGSRRADRGVAGGDGPAAVLGAVGRGPPGRSGSKPAAVPRGAGRLLSLATPVKLH